MQEATEQSDSKAKATWTPATILAVVGGALMVIGALLPWGKYSLETGGVFGGGLENLDVHSGIAGLSFTAGLLAFVAGAVAAAGGAYVATKQVRAREIGIVLVVVGLLGAAFALSFL